MPKDYERMLHWLVKAAEQGDTDSQRDLGWCYHEEVGVSMDYAKAVRWYRIAARAGDKKAQYNLGLSYLAGDGVTASRGGLGIGWRGHPARDTARQGLDFVIYR